MSSLLSDSQLTDEAEIVWLEDPDKLDYVRQALDKVNSRRGKPRYERDGRIIGYTNLAADAERDPDSGLFARRTFFLLPHDRPNDPTGPYAVGAPGEAIDPGTVEPGKVGAKTPRSQKGDTAGAVPFSHCSGLVHGAKGVPGKASTGLGDAGASRKPQVGSACPPAG